MCNKFKDCVTIFVIYNNNLQKSKLDEGNCTLWYNTKYLLTLLHISAVLSCNMCTNNFINMFVFVYICDVNVTTFTSYLPHISIQNSDSYSYPIFCYSICPIFC